MGQSVGIYRHNRRRQNLQSLTLPVARFALNGSTCMSPTVRVSSVLTVRKDATHENSKV